MNRTPLTFGLLSFLFCLYSVLAFADPKAPVLKKTSLQATTQVTQGSTEEAGKININTASASELQNLKGIGKKRAEDIVKNRETNGPFTSPQDLTRIKGIGPKTVEKNLAIITVGTVKQEVNPKSEDAQIKK